MAAQGAAYAGPVNVGSDLLDRDGAVAFALDADGDVFAKALANRCGLAQVADGSAATCCKGFALGGLQRGKVCEDFFHAAYLTLW